jgi:hypothetical protein
MEIADNKSMQQGERLGVQEKIYGGGDKDFSKQSLSFIVNHGSES